MNRPCLIRAHSSRNTRVIPYTSSDPWHQITFLAALLIHVAPGTFPRLDRSAEVRRRKGKRKMGQFHEKKKKNRKKGGAEGAGGGGFGGVHGEMGGDPFSNVPAACSEMGDAFATRRRWQRGINHIQAALGCT